MSDTHEGITFELYDPSPSPELLAARDWVELSTSFFFGRVTLVLGGRRLEVSCPVFALLERLLHAYCLAAFPDAKIKLPPAVSGAGVKVRIDQSDIVRVQIGGHEDWLSAPSLEFREHLEQFAADVVSTFCATFQRMSDWMLESSALFPCLQAFRSHCRAIDVMPNAPEGITFMLDEPTPTAEMLAAPDWFELSCYFYLGRVAMVFGGQRREFGAPVLAFLEALFMSYCCAEFTDGRSSSGIADTGGSVRIKVHDHDIVEIRLRSETEPLLVHSRDLRRYLRNFAAEMIAKIRHDNPAWLDWIPEGTLKDYGLRDLLDS